MKEKTNSTNTWWHAGGKLIEEGADKLSDAELLSIFIGTGIKGKSAEDIANEIIRRFGGYRGMANRPLGNFLDIKGLGDVKIIRIAAAFEFARRITNIVLEQQPDKKVVPKNAHEDVIAWDGKLYRALHARHMLPDEMDEWIKNHGENIHKISADRKVVFGFNHDDEYIVCNGKLYRSLTDEIMTFDEISVWTTKHRDILIELENFLQKYLASEKQDKK